MVYLARNRIGARLRTLHVYHLKTDSAYESNIYSLMGEDNA